MSAPFTAEGGWLRPERTRVGGGDASGRSKRGFTYLLGQSLSNDNIFLDTCVTTWPCLEYIYRGGDEDEGNERFWVVEEEEEKEI